MANTTTVTIPKELVDKIDNDPDMPYISRSSKITQILAKHYEKKASKKH